LKATVLVPLVAPKLAPAIVTDVPTGPLVGLRVVILGATDANTVNATPLLATPPTVTVTGPVVAPLGTGATILVALQLVGVAVVPLNRSVLVPCVVPKFAPAIVTAVPTLPDVGDRVVILGATGANTVNATALLAIPPTVTTMFPVVAVAGTGTTRLVFDHVVGVPLTPLKVTVLFPLVAPKLVPVIVTAVPTTPLVGSRVVMLGGGVAAAAGLKAARAAPHWSAVANVAVAADVPAAASIRVSATSFVFGAAGTLS